MTPAERVAAWVIERENVRLRRESHTPQAGMTYNYSNDPIFRTYRFCNVWREDDKVTRWLKKHWRDPYAGHPNMTAAMLLARMVNWPPTLEAIGFPDKFSPEKIVAAIHGMGGKAWSAAYIVSTCGRKMDKALYVVQTVAQVQANPAYAPQPGDTLQAVWQRLRAINGLGAGFIAAQVVADLKYVPGNPLATAPDWWSWAASGPGSRRGLNRYHGLLINDPWREEDWHTALLNFMDEVRPLTCDIGEIHAQDWQNVLCEFDKYERVKLGQGKPRKRYTPETAYQV